MEQEMTDPSKLLDPGQNVEVVNNQDDSKPIDLDSSEPMFPMDEPVVPDVLKNQLADADAEVSQYAENDIIEGETKRERKKRLTVVKEPEIAKFLPTQERVQVYKRQPNAQWAFVGSYSRDDIKESSSIEIFLKENVAILPHIGGGLFAIYLIDKNGKRTYRGTTTILQPATEKKPGDDLLGIFDKYTETMKEKDKETERRVKDSRTELFQLISMANQQNKPIDPMMFMMMMQNFNKQPDTNSLGTILGSLRETIQRATEPQRSPFDMMPSLNLPPLDMSGGSNGSTEMVKALAEIIKAQRPEQQQPQLTAKDLLDIVRAQSEQKTKLSDVIAMLTPLVTVAAPIVTSFVTAARERQDKMLDRLEAMNKEIIDLKTNPQNDLAKTLASIRALKGVSDELGNNGSSEFVTIISNILENLPGVMQAAAVMKTAIPGGTVQEVHGQKQLLASTSTTKKDEEETLEVSDDAKDFLSKMEGASNDNELLEQIALLFKMLWSIDEWKKFLTPGLQAILKKNKKSAVEFAANLFDGFLGGDVISKRLRDRAIDVFTRNFEDAFSIFTSASKPARQVMPVTVEATSEQPPVKRIKAKPKKAVSQPEEKEQAPENTP